MYWSLSFPYRERDVFKLFKLENLRFACTFCSQKSLSTVTLLQCWLISFKLYVQNEVGILRYLWPKLSVFSRPFSGYLVTLFENEYFKKTFHMERNLILWKWTCKRNTFLRECTKTRFETEAKANSEIACLKRYTADLVCSTCDIAALYEVDVIIEGTCWTC